MELFCQRVILSERSSRERRAGVKLGRGSQLPENRRPRLFRLFPNKEAPMATMNTGAEKPEAVAEMRKRKKLFCYVFKDASIIPRSNVSS